MKALGVFLLVIGAIWVLVAFNMDTTVSTESQFIGGVYLPSQRVNNLGKMDDRRNHLMVSSLLVVVGVIMLLVGKSENNNESPSTEASNGGSQKIKTNSYTGDRDIKLGRYQLFLTEKYSITKNNTLEKYVVGDELFDTLDDSLRYADEKETLELMRRFKNAYLISSVAKDSNAFLSGIKTNDIFVAYNKYPITNDQDIDYAISSLSDSNPSMTVLRAGQKLDIPIQPGRLGIYGSIISLESHDYQERIKDLKA